MRRKQKEKNEHHLRTFALNEHIPLKKNFDERNRTFFLHEKIQTEKNAIYKMHKSYKISNFNVNKNLNVLFCMNRFFKKNCDKGKKLHVLTKICEIRK